MNMATKKDILEEYVKEYLKASTERKSEILDVITEVTKLHRKSVIRRFRRLQLQDPGHQEQRGRPVYFTKDVDAALYTIWDAANRPCGELLFPLILDYLLILERDNMWTHSDEATGKLRNIKEHTVRRRVKDFMEKYERIRGISSTKPTHLKSIIPIFKGPWSELPPGHGQIDTVAHCGSSLSGDFVYTTNYVDSATYWCIPRAQWNKGQVTTLASMDSIKNKLPVRLLGAHPDSGSEFINWNAKDWCDENDIELTRSEPGRKNDNMYIEERNGHVVRKYLGYVRFDTREVVPVINELYDVLSLYLNHFQVVRRTETKTRVGAKYVRTYEKQPLTPYARMLAHPEVTEEVKESLRLIHASLNPLPLKEKVDTLLSKIYKIQKDSGS